MAGWIDAEERRLAVDGDSCDYPVILRINHGDCAGLSVDYVDFIAKRIGSQIRRVDAHLQGPVLAEIDEIENGNSVGTAVADIGKLPITRGHIGESASSAA